MTGDPKWHERTPTLVIASLAALAAIGLIVWLTMFMLRQVGTPDPTPLEFVTPVFSDTSTSGSTTTTTSTITSTVAPETTEMTDVSTPESSESTEPSESSASSEASTPSESSTERTTTVRTRQSDADDHDDESTTRRRPRLNETRILNPVP